MTGSWKTLSQMAAGCLMVALFAARVEAAVPAHPDLSGIWEIEGTFNPAAPPPRPAPPPFNKAYQAKYEANLALVKANRLDLGAICSPPGMPRIATMIGQFEVLNTPGRMTIIYEYQSQVRRIYFNTRPADVEPTMNGDSRAHWEGEVLVIDTVAMKPFSYLDNTAGPRSDQTHVIERVSLLGKDVMQIDTTVEDPVALAGPWHYSHKYQRPQNGMLIDDECNENPRNPINPDGSVGFTFQGGQGQ